MPLHLIKLAVGCESVKELKGWVAERIATARKKGLPLRHVHITRMTPKRDEEILAGGSLYWVIKGEIAAREKLIAIEPFRDKDGIGRCRLVMQPKVLSRCQLVRFAPRDDDQASDGDEVRDRHPCFSFVPM